MEKELGKRAITNRLTKYQETHYKDEIVQTFEMEDYHTMKFFTATRSVILSSDDYGHITEKVRARRNTKNKTEQEIVEKPQVSEEKPQIEVEKPQKEHKISQTKDDIVVESKPKEHNYLHLKEGDIVENIYTGIRYKVLSINGNTTRLANESNQYEMLTMAISDVMKRL